MTTNYTVSYFDEGAMRPSYRSEPSTMPKWYRRVTREYNRKAKPNGLVRSLGWELDYTTGRFHTCPKYEVCHTTWRH